MLEYAVLSSAHLAVLAKTIFHISYRKQYYDAGKVWLNHLSGFYMMFSLKGLIEIT